MLTIPGDSGVAASDRTDSHFVVDLTGEIEIKKGVRLFATIENLADEEYIVARRPAGARPGRPLTFVAGVNIGL